MPRDNPSQAEAIRVLAAAMRALIKVSPEDAQEQLAPIDEHLFRLEMHYGRPTPGLSPAGLVQPFGEHPMDRYVEMRIAAPPPEGFDPRPQSPHQVLVVGAPGARDQAVLRTTDLHEARRVADHLRGALRLAYDTGRSSR